MKTAFYILVGYILITRGVLDSYFAPTNRFKYLIKLYSRILMLLAVLLCAVGKGSQYVGHGQDVGIPPAPQALFPITASASPSEHVQMKKLHRKALTDYWHDFCNSAVMQNGIPAPSKEVCGHGKYAAR